MVVAVDIRGSQQYQEFIYGTCKIISANHPGYTFIIICDTPLEPSYIFSENVIPVVIKQKGISLLQQFTISSLLKKHKADVFVTAELLASRIPQCLIAFDIYSPASLKRANTIIVRSEFSKKEMVGKYKIDDRKIHVIYQSPGESFQPLPFEEKEKIKEQYADGNEYFLSVVTTKDHLLNLLKAFSIFKKMQKSNMQLLVALHTPMKNDFSEELRLYKFKSEVKVLDDIGKKALAGTTGAAYAFIYPYSNKEYLHVLEAMKCNVPAITTKEEEIYEVCGEAVLYVSTIDHIAIADKMMLIYKDENLRKQLIEKGQQQVNKYSRENSAGLLWQSIEKACR